MDSTVQTVSIHLVGALVSAVLSTAFTLGWFGFKNDVLAFAIGIVILYAIGQLCQKYFGEEIKGFSAWLWDGILPFGFCWFIAWTILTSYL
ncbi:hypothetical protein [uncultured Methanobrevibacter sp.]|uniref:EMC6-like membrane protein n=1 Tax=uncultured Methanobrevibacter sp. TaxID=253161 RepID=UPI002622748A